MDKRLSAVPETMLLTTYARARASEEMPQKFYDEKAVEIIKELDFDFTKAENDKLMRNGAVGRAILLDEMVSAYLEKHYSTVVVNIACGLDTRCYRMKGKYKAWYNLDLPETIAVRTEFLKEEKPLYVIAKSAMDASWADEIKEIGGNVLIIIEGLTMYLSQKDVQEIFSVIDKKFLKAAVFVEGMNPMVVKKVKEKSIDERGAKFSWGVKSGEEFEKLIPPFKYKGDRSVAEGMARFKPAYKIISKISFARNISNRIYIFEK